MREYSPQELLQKDNTCVPLLFYILKGGRMHHRKILDICIQYGWKERYGIQQLQIPKVARKLGFKVYNEQIKLFEIFMEEIGSLKRNGKYLFPTLSMVKRHCSKGVYILGMSTHATILVDGIISDIFEKKFVKKRSRIINMWKVKLKK